MTFSVLFIYAIASFTVIIIPGPTMLLALSNGATRNFSVTWLGMLGAVCADLVLITAVCLGLGAIFLASETLFLILKWCGVVYLVYLAVHLWRAKPVEVLTKKSIVRDKLGSKAFLRAFLVAVSNPKGLLFFTAFFPQFININVPQVPQYVILAITSSLINIIIMSCYAFGGFHAARVLTYKGMKRINQGCAATMLGLALFLALYRKG